MKNKTHLPVENFLMFDNTYKMIKMIIFLLTYTQIYAKEICKRKLLTLFAELYAIAYNRQNVSK